MRKWKVSMPCVKVPAGCADVILAYRTSTGERVELQAKMSITDADMLMCSAITSMQTFKAANRPNMTTAGDSKEGASDE